MQIIGHRGARGLAPENSLESLGHALKHHVNEIEIDVRVTGDNQVVLNHNRSVSDASGRRLDVDDHTYSQLLKHRPGLCTLAQAIEFVDKLVPLQIEIKPDEPTAPIVNVIIDYLNKDWQPTDFVVSSRDFDVLKAVHQELPEVPLCVIEYWSGVRAGHRARRLGTKRVSMSSHWLWWGFISATARGGWQLSVWSINKPLKAKKWQKYGLWGVITDYPDRFLDYNK